ncbi:hypothetical protein Tco_0214757 [Tanacetum coccineum]
MRRPYERLMADLQTSVSLDLFGCSLTILNTRSIVSLSGKSEGRISVWILLLAAKVFKSHKLGHKKRSRLSSYFLENQENQKGKGPDWMFDLDLLTPSMNYIPVRKENYADSGGKVSTFDDVEDLDDQQFIVHGPSIHAAQPMHSEERTADKEVPLSSEEQALHDELMRLMHQESLAKAHNDAQRIAFEEEKRRIALTKGKESVNSTFTLSTANTPSQSTGNTPTDSDDDVPKDGVFSTNSFDDENTDKEEEGEPDYNNMDHTIDVSSTPTLRIHKDHPQSQIIGKSTAGVLTRRKLKESDSVQHQALLSFIYKQNRTNHKDQQTCLFACFLSQEEPKKVSQALADESWVEHAEETALNSSYKNIRVLLTYHMAREVISKLNWLSETRGDERGTIIKNKARLVAQGRIFENLCKRNSRLSSRVKLTFLFGTQVKQTSAGHFLGKDEEGKDVDVHLYRFHVNSKEAFSDSDYARDNHDRRQLQEDVQYLEKTGLLHARNKQLWLYHLQRQNM